MLSSFAAFIDHRATRIALLVSGLLATLLFGPFAAILLGIHVWAGEFGEEFFLGLGGCLGLVGWWGRLCVRAPALVRRARLRRCLAVFLAAGILSAIAVTGMFRKDAPGFPILWTMAGIGVVLLLGTLGATRPDRAGTPAAAPIADGER